MPIKNRIFCEGTSTILLLNGFVISRNLELSQLVGFLLFESLAYLVYLFCPRYISVTRSESHEVLVMLARITEDMDLDEVALTPKGPVKAPERLEAYESECSREVLTDEDYEDLHIRLCFKKVRSDKISLDGPGGHSMRIGAVMELATQGLSISSIVRWFDFCTDCSPGKTETAVKDLISRGYTDKHVDEYGREHRKGLKCTTIQRCGFCLVDASGIYRRKHGG